MNQFIKYVELYVQWVALAVAVLWVAFVGYTYWLNPYVTVTIKGQPQTPEKVDSFIASQGEVIKLENDIASDVPAGGLDVPNKTIVDEFTLKLGMPRPVYNVAMVTPFFQGNAPPLLDHSTFEPPKLAAVATIPIFNPSADDPDADDTITMLGPVAGLSQVQIPIDKPALAPAAPAAGANPNGNNQPPAPAAPTFKLADVGWVTVSGRFNNVACIAAMNEAKIHDPQLMKTAFLRVFLEREELVGTAWTNTQIIKPIPVNGMPNFPENGKFDDKAKEAEYREYAAPTKEGADASHTANICNPLFYVVNGQQGTIWRTWTMPGPATQPATLLNVPDQKALDEANQKKRDEEQRKAAAAAAAHRSSSSGSGSSGSSSYGHTSISGGSRSIRDAARSVMTSPSSSKPPVKPSTPSPAPVTPVVAPVSETPSGPVKPPTGAPQGLLDPTAAGQFEIWAHDVTAEPGHTYRYRLHVYFLNPLYHTVNLAKNPKDADVFAAPAAITDWSDAVTVPSRSHLFVTYVTPAGQNPTSALATIDVLYFVNGLWMSSQTKFGLGDEVMPKDPVLPSTADPSCLDTGWFIVDFPVSAGVSGQVVLSNAHNEKLVRTVKKDSGDPGYIELKNKANKNTSVTPSGSGSVTPPN